MRETTPGWVALLLCGCEAFSDLRVIPHTGADLDLSYKIDSATTSSPCRAARGLSGELLKESGSGQVFCIDFDSGMVSDSTLASHEWVLGASTIGCQGFLVDQGRLTIKAPMQAPLPECVARMPQLLVPPNTTKVVVAIIHTLSFTSETQFGQIETLPGTQKTGWSGLNTTAPQTAILTFQPEGSSFQGVLRAANSSMSAMSLLPAWQIQSLAVLAIK